MIENTAIPVVAAVLFQLTFVEILTDEHHGLFTKVGLSFQVNAHLFALLQGDHLAVDYAFRAQVFLRGVG